MTAIAEQAIWVDNVAQLQALCARWRQQAAVALDTEFMRTTTFYPQAALFQVGDGRGCYLIDPLAIDDFSAFRELLSDTSVTKVMHSCSEDLEVLQYFLQTLPDPLFDTQLAAAFTGEGFSLGYAALVEKQLGISLAKEVTRSDWLQRPLSTAQLQYAALDVAYLPVIYGILVKQLRERQRLDWVEQDCAAIIASAAESPDPDAYYQRIKLAWKLKPQQLAVLQQLASWRECEARLRDVPRNRLLKENVLWELAARQPQRLSQLKAVDGFPPRLMKSDGNQLIDLIGEALDLPPDRWPGPLPRPLTPDQGQLLKQLRARVRDIAEQLNLAPEVLTRKKDFEALIRSAGSNGHYKLPESLRGWREGVVGDPLLEVVKSTLQSE